MHITPYPAAKAALLRRGDLLFPIPAKAGILFEDRIPPLRSAKREALRRGGKV